MSNEQTNVALTEKDLEEMDYYLDSEDNEEKDPTMNYIKSILKNKRYYHDKYMDLVRERRSHQINTRIMSVIMTIIVAIMCFIIFAQHMVIIGRPINFLNNIQAEQTTETMSKTFDSEIIYKLPDLKILSDDRTILNQEIKLIPSNDMRFKTLFDFTIDNNNLTNNKILYNLDIDKI